VHWNFKPKGCNFFRGFQQDIIKKNISKVHYLDYNVENINELWNSKKSLVGKIVYGDSKIIIGLYEHYITVADILSKESGLYDGEVIIIDNNLFKDIYPFPSDYMSLEELYTLFQSEKDSNETVEVSQGNIIAQIIQQCQDCY